MEQHFNCTEIVMYDGKPIPVHWTRNEYTQKTGTKYYEEDDGLITVGKDYISFQYNGMHIQDSYESDKYDLQGRVYDICSTIDSGKLEELTKMNVKWKKGRI